VESFSIPLTRQPQNRSTILHFSSTSVGAREDDVGLGGPLWSPAVPVHFAPIEERGYLPSPPTGDHQGLPYGSSSLLPTFMALVYANWAPHAHLLNG
jgi:hypothetical protein